MDVHAAAVLAVDGLGHERGVEPVHAGHPFDHVAEEHADVGHGQGVGEAQVDLVLTVGDLVVVVLRRDAHPLEQNLDLLADLAMETAEEVAARVLGNPQAVVGEDEELELRADVEAVEAEVLVGPRQGPLEHAAGIAGVGRFIRIQDVAEHDRLAPFGVGVEAPVGPGEDPAGRRVGLDVQVAFLDADEAFDG